jgi:hypothetical protein
MNQNSLAELSAISAFISVLAAIIGIFFSARYARRAGRAAERANEINERIANETEKSTAIEIARRESELKAEAEVKSANERASLDVNYEGKKITVTNNGPATANGTKISFLKTLDDPQLHLTKPIIMHLPEDPEDLRCGESFYFLCITTMQSSRKFLMKLEWSDGDGPHEEKRKLTYRNV